MKILKKYFRNLVFFDCCQFEASWKWKLSEWQVNYAKAGQKQLNLCIWQNQITISLSASIVLLSQYKHSYWSDSYVLAALKHTQSKVFQFVFKRKFDKCQELLIVFNMQNRMQPGKCIFCCCLNEWVFNFCLLGFKLDAKSFSATYSKIFSYPQDFISNVINNLLLFKFKHFCTVTNRGKSVMSCKVLIGFSLMFKLSTLEYLEMFC